MNLSVSKSNQLLSSRKGQGISCSRFRWAVPSPARNRAADPPASAPAAGGDAVVRRASRVHATDAAGVRDAARRRAAILIAERPRRSEADCGPRMAASTQTSGRACCRRASVRRWGRAQPAADSSHGAPGERPGQTDEAGDAGVMQPALTAGNHLQFQ